MKEPIEKDETIVLLRSLPEIDIDKQRARGIRNRACIILSNKSRRTASMLTVIEKIYSRILEPVLITGLTAAFLAWIVTRCFDVFSRFPDRLL